MLYYCYWDFFKYIKVNILRIKDEVIEIFFNYKVEVENKLKRKIKRFRFYRKWEYEVNIFKEFREKNGIIFEIFVFYIFKQNGLVKRKIESVKIC